MNIERSAQIGRMKKQYASLSKSIPTLHDTNTFINLVNTEAKRLGLKVISFRRSGSNPRTMITEHNYDFKFQGTYAHYVLLLNRISLSKNLVSVLGSVLFTHPWDNPVKCIVKILPLMSKDCALLYFGLAPQKYNRFSMTSLPGKLQNLFQFHFNHY